MVAVAYRGATVLDGTGAAPAPGRRSSWTTAGSTRVVATDARVPPDGAEVVDLAGRFVIPGLIDSHQHLATPPDRAAAEAVLRRQVYGGVTAIRDMADDLRQVADLARAALVGEIPGPDIHYAALMAGPGFFDDPRTWQVVAGRDARARCPGCRRSPTRPTSRSPWRWPAAPTPPRSRSTPTCPADRSPAITAEAHRQGIAGLGAPAVFPALPLRGRRRRAWTWSRTSRCWPGRPRPTRPDVQGQAADRPGHVRPGRPAHRRACSRRCVERGTILDATASMWESDEASARRRRGRGRPGAGQRRARGRADRAGLRGRRADLRRHRLRDRCRTTPSRRCIDELDFLRERCGMPPPRCCARPPRSALAASAPRTAWARVEAGQARQLRRPRRGPGRRHPQPAQHLVHRQARRPPRPRRTSPEEAR